MSEPETKDVLHRCIVRYRMDSLVPKGLPDKARTQEVKRKMRREDKVVLAAVAFLALYGGFLWWGSQAPPPKPVAPYPKVDPKGYVLEYLRPDPVLSAHPDGSLFWRIQK